MTVIVVRLRLRISGLLPKINY